MKKTAAALGVGLLVGAPASAGPALANEHGWGDRGHQS
jgi:hypothetical protein